MKLSKVNLNLLQHFDTLYREKSVSRAAKRTFVTQAAMSHILRQLRELFNDDLFVKTSFGLKPTKKAKELHPKVRLYLNAASQIFDEGFDPSESRMTINAALSSYGEYLYLPKIYLYMREHCPGIFLNTMTLPKDESLEDILAHDIDFVIAPRYIIPKTYENQKNSELLAKLLMNERGVCVVSKTHPLANEKITKADFLSLDHIDIIFNDVGRDNVNQSIKDFDKRNIILSVSNVISALEIVSQSECIATIPEGIAKYYQQHYDLVLKTFPLSTELYRILFLYHKRLQNYQFIDWLYNLIHGFDVK